MNMQLYRRENYLKKIRGFFHADDIIKVITGVRRCGKSCLMQTIAEELSENGVPNDNIIFLDLDQRGYRSIKTSDQLEELIENKGTAKGKKYLFIDEIQNVTGFEELLNGFRSEGGWSIFITGSNSYLLSGEIATKLTGRYLEFELFPLSFEEYELMKAFYDIPLDPLPNNEMNQFILEGGFPRTLFLNSMEDKRTYTRGVIQEIFHKDIKKRVKIKNPQTFEQIQNFIINNFGATISIRSLWTSLRHNGYSVSQATAAKYIRALIEAKIIYECTRFDMKSKKSLSGEKKYYLADMSFYFANNTDNRINYGPVLENLTYIYARAHDYSVSVGKIGTLECDFILRDTMMQYAYIQVAYTIFASKKTEDREYRPLEEIRDNYPKYVATVDPFPQKRNGIIHINLINFMKNGESFT